MYFAGVLRNRETSAEFCVIIEYNDFAEERLGSMNIRFSPPDITEEEIAAAAEAMRSGWITTGPRTKAFERRIAEYCGTGRAACLSSATAGLELVLRILGIGEGDEVITSAYTYTASASVIAHTGARIVLCDIDPRGFELDLNKLDKLVTERTKAIIPVDIGGRLCDYEGILRLAESKRALFRPANALQAFFGRPIVLADAAHSFGAERGGRRSGAFADFTSFSFHAVKNLTTAEGGAVTWRPRPGLDGEELYRRLMLGSLHGQSKDALSKNRAGAWEYDIEELGYKCNMTDIMAAIGSVQLDRYPALLQRREALVRRYDRAFGEGFSHLQHFGTDEKSSFHLYLLRPQRYCEEERNRLIGRLAEAGIACNVHYKPLPMFTAYRRLGFRIEDFPAAYEVYRNEITLPLHTLLTDEQADYVIGQVQALL